jgi:DNA/RNA-binding domain of Phe-tRNA-synthetase-like protein
MTTTEPQLVTGWIDDALAAEFPGLGLHTCTVVTSCGRSPRYVREQLRYMSNKVVGDRAVNLRREPIAHGYRVFFRQIGLDPDEARTPIEAVMLERLRRGRFASAGLPADALTITIVESGVALCAFDADAVEGRVGLRLAGEGERPANDAREPPLAAGTIVLADEQKALGPVFGITAAAVTPTRSTTRVTVCAVGVAGVPEMIVEEALWKCSKALLEVA